MTSIRILLADGDAGGRDALRLHLPAEADVVAQVDRATMLDAAVRTHAPDVVVADIALPGDLLEAVKQLRMARERVPVLLVAERDEANLVDHALRLKPCGFVVRADAAHRLAHAVRALSQGRMFLGHVVVGAA